MRKYKYEEGEKVAHRSDLKTALFVERIMFKKIERLLTDNKGLGIKDETGNYKKKKETRIAGIEVSFVKDEVPRKIKLHSRNIIPWHVAEKGDKYVTEWINNQNEL